jgi:hypothetical protein
MWPGAARRSIFQSFTSDDEMRFLGRRLKYPPVLDAQRVVRKNVQSILIVENDRETSGLGGLNLSYQ